MQRPLRSADKAMLQGSIASVMTNTASEEYLRNAVLTATPEQLHLMLYDGAIRFIRQAGEALRRKEYDAGCEKLLRAQKIITEMKSGLRPEVQPELCEQMAGLYNFVYWRLVDANLQHDETALTDALQILEYQRETWRMLVEKVRQGDSSSVASRSQTASPARESLCLQG